MQRLEDTVTPFRSTLLLLATGMLGAGLALAVLLVIPTDAAPSEYGRLLSEELPVLVFVAATGFGMGVLVAFMWGMAQRLLARHAPRA
jgi:hypothetical protein